MRYCARSSAACRYGLASLIGIYAVLWIGGTVWHSLTCCHYHHTPSSSCEIAHQNAFSDHHCCHDHDDDSQPSDDPAAPPHDEDDCPICQWFGQAQSAPEVAMSNFDEKVIGFADSFSAESPREILVRLYQSRAPPA